VQLAFPFFCQASTLFEEYKFCACVQQKNARNQKKVLHRPTALGDGCAADFAAASQARRNLFTAARV
jgi:hypothetical protein